ncbi:MAG: hypothetical protein Q4F60_02030 [Candidatus Saccharibacteria bacterium]|nr:hypothetical protein [Candidatus Saccharibacteria bacterium]
MAERVAADDDKKKETRAEVGSRESVKVDTKTAETEKVIGDESAKTGKTEKVEIKTKKDENEVSTVQKKPWKPKKIVRDKMIEMDLTKIDWDNLDFKTVERIQAVLKENGEREKLREMRDDVMEEVERKKERVARRKLEREIAEGKVASSVALELAKDADSGEVDDPFAESADSTGRDAIELPNGKKTKVLTKAEHKAEKNAYIARKKKVVETLEPSNRRKVVFFRAMDGFWKVGGTSAVIFYRKILPRVDKKARLRFSPDNDWNYLFDYGVCSVRNIDVYVKKILKYPGIRLVADSEDYKSFLLRYEITETEFQTLVNQDEIMKKALMAKILKTQPMQNFYFELMELIRMVHSLDMHHTERITREVYVREIEELLTDMVAIYIMMTKNGMPQKVAVEKLKVKLARISAIILEMDEIGGWTHRECGKVGDLVAEVERGIRK